MGCFNLQTQVFWRTRDAKNGSLWDITWVIFWADLLACMIAESVGAKRCVGFGTGKLYDFMVPSKFDVILPRSSFRR